MHTFVAQLSEPKGFQSVGSVRLQEVRGAREPSAVPLDGQAVSSGGPKGPEGFEGFEGPPGPASPIFALRGDEPSLLSSPWPSSLEASGVTLSPIPVLPESEDRCHSGVE